MWNFIGETIHPSFETPCHLKGRERAGLSIRTGNAEPKMEGGLLLCLIYEYDLYHKNNNNQLMTIRR
jgi:hypothetical protein